MYLTLLALPVLFALLYLYLKRSQYDSGVKTLPYALPLIGHVLKFATLSDIFGELVKFGEQAVQAGDVVKLFIGTHAIYFITDPDDAATTLNTCLKKMFVYNWIEPIFGKILVAAEVPVWKRNRRLMDAAFKQRVLDNYQEFFNHQAQRLVNALNKEAGKGYVDLVEIINWNVLETSFQTTMGKIENEDEISQEYIAAIHSLFKIIVQRALKPWLFFDIAFKASSYGKEFDRNFKIVTEQSERMLQLRNKEYIDRMSNKSEPHDTDSGFQSFLDFLLELNKGIEGDVFTHEEMRKFSDNLLLAALDTTSYELFFILLCIGTHREVQDKLYEEITTVMGDEVFVTKDHLSKLVYLDAVVKEGLRLYPIAPVITRHVDQNLKLKNVTIYPGSSIVVHIWAINRHKKRWGPDADQFKPERWLDETNDIDQTAFLSFSSGRRNCIGKSYSMIYLKTTLVPVLKRFVMQSNHKEVQFECYIMLKAISGHLMKLDLR